MLAERVGSADETTSFALAVRELRKQRGMTQEDLARRARVSVTTLSNLENQHRVRIYPSTKQRIANALGVALADLDSSALAEQIATRLLTPEQRAAIQDILAAPPEMVAVVRQALAKFAAERRRRKGQGHK
jgi:transcriptional regulator with XRE-family HTH domain